MVQQIAVDANRLAALHRLGTPIAVYKPSTTLTIIGGLVAIIFGVVWVVVAFYIVNSVVSSFSSTSLPTILGLVIPLFGLLFVLIGSLALLKAFLNRNLRVYVH